MLIAIPAHFRLLPRFLRPMTPTFSRLLAGDDVLNGPRRRVEADGHVSAGRVETDDSAYVLEVVTQMVNGLGHVVVAGRRTRCINNFLRSYSL